jgi:hypothetical protein
MRAISSDGGIRVIFCDSTEIVKKSCEIHQTSKTMTAVLGRALTGTSLMASLLKDKDNTLTFQLRGDGPCGSVVCVGDYMGNVRGYADDPTVELPPNELGKLDGCTEEEAYKISEMVGLGALKYFILKVDPKKTMLFDPRESIDFNGNTGPFIQYTHARIRSILRKAAEAGITTEGYNDAALLPEEIELIKALSEYPAVVRTAGQQFAPSVIAAYAYDLAKQFNGYYHDHSILKEENSAVRSLRLKLASEVARVIRSAMALLGINVPERM